MPTSTVPIRASQGMYEELIKLVREGRASTQTEALDRLFLDLKSTVAVQAVKIEELTQKVEELEKEVEHWKGLATA